MPPASPATVFIPRIVSSKVVLPWSTWPITATIGGRSDALSDGLCKCCVAAAPTSFRFSCTAIFSSSTMISAVSKSIRWLIVATIPFLNNSPTSCVTGKFKVSANSPTVIESAMVRIFSGWLISLLSTRSLSGQLLTNASVIWFFSYRLNSG